jgi:hypothetical protein
VNLSPSTFSFRNKSLQFSNVHSPLSRYTKSTHCRRLHPLPSHPALSPSPSSPWLPDPLPSFPPSPSLYVPVHQCYSPGNLLFDLLFLQQSLGLYGGHSATFLSSRSSVLSISESLPFDLLGFLTESPSIFPRPPTAVCSVSYFERHSPNLSAKR